MKKIETLNTGVAVVSLSPHETNFSDGSTVAGADEDVVKATSLVDTSSPQGEIGQVKLVRFGRGLSESFAQAVGALVGNADQELRDRPDMPLLILAPAMLSSLPQEDWEQVRNGMSKISRRVAVVAFIATTETQRSRPQEKVAKSDEFSLIAELA